MTEKTSPPSIPTPTVSIELLGKNYQIKCEENEIPALQKAAEHLNNTMKKMPPSGKLLAPEKLGIMAALNLASQFLALEQQMNEQLHFLNLRLQHVQEKIEEALINTSETTSFRLEVEPAQA